MRATRQIMEAAIKSALGTKIFKDTGVGGGGCISNGSTYLTDNGPVFVKVNHKSKAEEMFVGEKAGLEAILATKTVRVPKPYCVVTFGQSSSALVMESVKMKSLSRKMQAELGERLARMHLHNAERMAKLETESARVTQRSTEDDYDDKEELSVVRKFGFDVPTSCGYIAQPNTWEDDWATFYIRHKLQFQVDELMKSKGDRELKEVWEPCVKKIETELGKIKPVPSLLHGDLWSGNAASVDNEPIIYDPAAFYGHSEYDLGIANMFGGFTDAFYESYHRLIPTTDGHEKRLDIYELFHHLNHWNHFGSSYRGSALRIMRRILAN